MSDPYARFDYAWKTAGWTSQNPTFPEGSAGDYYDPGLPEDVSKVRLYGSYRELDTGRALSGVLRLRVDQVLIYTPTGEEVLSGGFRPIRFRRSGFSVYLPATDDPQLTPEFQYEARLTVRGIVRRYKFSLPAATPEVNLATLPAL